MKLNWFTGIAAGLLVLLAVGCAKEVIPPSAVMPDAAPLNAKIDAATAKAAANQQRQKWWDVYLPYIELAEFPETGVGIWLVAIVDEDGNYVWNYSSDLKEFHVNPQKLATELQAQFNLAKPELTAGNRAWSEVFDNDDYRSVLYFSPLPAEAEIQREGAKHPQYLVLLLVEPQLEN